MGTKLKKMKLKQTYIKLEAKKRLYNLKTPIIGLTGGIASGKSSVINILQKLHYSIIDADQLVKEIYQTDETKKFIEKNYPNVVSAEKINFKQLRNLFFTTPDIKQKIEQYIYQKLPSQFLAHFDKQDQPFVIYDVPLLFEKDLYLHVDISICVYCTRDQQIDRIVTRDDCTIEDAGNILAHQGDLDHKRDLADFIIDNSKQLEDLEKEVCRITDTIFVDTN